MASAGDDCLRTTQQLSSWLMLCTGEAPTMGIEPASWAHKAGAQTTTPRRQMINLASTLTRAKNEALNSRAGSKAGREKQKPTQNR